MSTAERIALGVVSLIALIAWLRWLGTREDQQKKWEDANPPLADNHQERNFPGPQVHNDQSSSLGPTLRGPAGGA